MGGVIPMKIFRLLALLKWALTTGHQFYGLIHSPVSGPPKKSQMIFRIRWGQVAVEKSRFSPTKTAHFAWENWVPGSQKCWSIWYMNSMKQHDNDPRTLGQATEHNSHSMQKLLKLAGFSSWFCCISVRMAHQLRKLRAYWPMLNGWS